MYQPHEHRHYEIWNPDGEFWMPVHLEQLEVGDRVRAFEPGGLEFQEFIVLTQPAFQAEDIGTGTVAYTVTEAGSDQEEV